MHEDKLVENSKFKVRLYQFKTNLSYTNITKINSYVPNIDDYKITFEDEIEYSLKRYEQLDYLFSYFNYQLDKKPTSHTGYSMSIGDILEFVDDDEFYLCMDIGWKKLENFKIKK